MDRRRTAGALLALAACIACANAAPRYSESTALDLHNEGAPSADGCYYNFQHYGEGDRIMTNEPCLNCTCHNQMLMCYLRVCPFTKPIGKECTLETRADLCCPIITCSDVPVDLLTSTESTAAAEYGMTGIGALDKYGCNINGKFLPEGAKVPPTPNKPCEHCYCIRNMTTCVMQECTLHVDGCTPIYHKDVCCPVRYSCDHTDDMPLMLDDMSTTEGTTPGIPWTTTAAPSVLQECTHGDEIFADGASIKTEKPCEHCYCMKGDIVCVVQACGTPMEMEGKNCTPVPPPEGQCCPVTYMCEEDNEFTTTELITEPPTKPTDYARAENKNQTTPTDFTEGSGHSEITDVPLHTTEKIMHTKSDVETEIKETTPPGIEMHETTTFLADEKEPHISTGNDGSSPPYHIETTTYSEPYTEHVLENKSTQDAEAHDESSTKPSLLTDTNTLIPEEDQTTDGYIESDNDTVKTSPDKEKEHDIPDSDNITKDDDAIKPSTIVPTLSSSDTTEGSGQPIDELEEEISKETTVIPVTHKYSNDITETPLILTTVSQDTIAPEQAIYEHGTPTIEEKEEKTTSKIISSVDFETTPSIDKDTIITDLIGSHKTSTPSEPFATDSTSISTDKKISDDTTTPSSEFEYTTSSPDRIDTDGIESSTTIIQESPPDVKEHEKETLTTPSSDIETKPSEELDEGLSTISHKPVSDNIYTTEPTKYSDDMSIKDENDKTTTQASLPHEVSTASIENESTESHTSIDDSRRQYEHSTTEGIEIHLDETTSKPEDEQVTHKVSTTISSSIDDNETANKQTTLAVEDEEPATTSKVAYEENITDKQATYESSLSTEEPDKDLNTVPDDEDLFTTQVSYTKSSTVADINIDDLAHTLSDLEELVTKKEYDVTTVSGPYTEQTETSTDYKEKDHSDENMYTTELVKITSDESSTTPIDDSNISMSLEDENKSQATEDGVKKDTQKTDAVEMTTQIIEKTTEKSDDLTENEIPEENVAPITSPGIIPGEGSCLIDGVTFSNNSIVPSTNKCQTSCKCMSSIVKCDTINCSPPPDNMMNCQPVYDTPESCCPSYICEDSKETLPPQPESHMAVTEQTTKVPERKCSGTECKIEEDNIVPVTTYQLCTSGKCENTQVPELHTSKENECGAEGCTPVMSSTEKMPVQDTKDCVDASCIKEIDDSHQTTKKDISDLHTTEGLPIYSETATNKILEKEIVTTPNPLDDSTKEQDNVDMSYHSSPVMEHYTTKEKDETVIDKQDITTPYYVELEVHSHENDVTEMTDHSVTKVDKTTLAPLDETIETKLSTLMPEIDVTEQIDEGLNTIIPDLDKPDSSADDHEKSTEPGHASTSPSAVTHPEHITKHYPSITDEDVTSNPTDIPVYVTESEITDKTDDFTVKPSGKPEGTNLSTVDELKKSTPSEYVTFSEQTTTQKSHIDHEHETEGHVSENDYTTPKVIAHQESTLVDGVPDKQATTEEIDHEKFTSKHPGDHFTTSSIAYEEITTSKVYGDDTTASITENDVTTHKSIPDHIDIDRTTPKTSHDHKHYDESSTNIPVRDGQSTTPEVYSDHETNDKEIVDLATQEPVTDSIDEIATTISEELTDGETRPHDELSTHKSITDNIDEESTTPKFHDVHKSSDRPHGDLTTQEPVTDSIEKESTTPIAFIVDVTSKPHDEVSTNGPLTIIDEESTTPKFHDDHESSYKPYDELSTHVPVTISDEQTTTPKVHIDYETTDKSNVNSIATIEPVTDNISEEATTPKVYDDLDITKAQDELSTHRPISVSVDEEATSPKVDIDYSDESQRVTTHEPVTDRIGEELTTPKVGEDHETTEKLHDELSTHKPETSTSDEETATHKDDRDQETTHKQDDELSTETTTSKAHEGHETSYIPLDELPARRTPSDLEQETTTPKVSAHDTDKPHEEFSTHEPITDGVEEVATTSKPYEEEETFNKPLDEVPPRQTPSDIEQESTTPKVDVEQGTDKPHDEFSTDGSVTTSKPYKELTTHESDNIDELGTTSEIYVDHETDKPSDEMSTHKPITDSVDEEETTTKVFDDHKVTDKPHDLTTHEPFTSGIDEIVTTPIHDDHESTNLPMRDSSADKATSPKVSEDHEATSLPHYDKSTQEPITDTNDQGISTSEVYVGHETDEPHHELSTNGLVTGSVYEDSTTPKFYGDHETTDKSHIDLTTQEEMTDSINAEATTSKVNYDHETTKPHDDLSPHIDDAITEPADEDSITSKPYGDHETSDKPHGDFTTHEVITDNIDYEGTTPIVSIVDETIKHDEVSTYEPITDGINEVPTTPKLYDDHKSHDEISTQVPVTIKDYSSDDEQTITPKVHLDHETTAKTNVDFVTQEPVTVGITEKATTAKIYHDLESDKPHDELSTHVPITSTVEEESTTPEVYVTHETTEKPRVDLSTEEMVTGSVGAESTTSKQYDDHEAHKPHDELSTYGPGGISEESTTTKPYVDLETTISIGESSHKLSTEDVYSEDKTTSKPYVGHETFIPEVFSTHKPVIKEGHESSSFRPTTLESDHNDETLQEDITTAKYVDEEMTTTNTREGSSESSQPGEVTTPQLDVKETEIDRETTTHKTISGDDHLQDYTKIPDPVTEVQDGLTTLLPESFSIPNKGEEIQTDNTDYSTSEPSKVASSEQPFESSEIPEPFTEKPILGEEEDQHGHDNFPASGYGQETDYGDDDQSFGPGTCRYGGKVYVSAQQIPRDDPCDFCFCFRSDIICLQQSCPPPIHGCHEEPIQGFCCPRYECPVSMATSLNVTTTTTTTTTTLPPHFLPHAYNGAAQRKGCQIRGQSYQVGEVVKSASGPCLHCTCGGDGKMKCDPKVCTPEPMLRQMIAAAVSSKRRR